MQRCPPHQASHDRRETPAAGNGRPVRTAPQRDDALKGATALVVRVVVRDSDLDMGERVVLVARAQPYRDPATRRWGPNHKLESRPNLPFNGFSNGL